MESAIEQAVNYFFESEAPFPGAAPPFGKKGKKSEKNGHESEDEDESDKPWEEEGMAEDQYKSPRYKKIGYGRAALSTKKGVSEGKITWLESDDNAMLGSINGVNFIFDQGDGDASLDPVIMSEDGSSAQIPIPARLVNSAYAAAGMSKGDARPFSKWLSESIEQLRPISDEEDSVFNEAMATIRTSPGGGFEIELSGDIDVNMDDDDDADDMKPVDSVAAVDASDADDDAEEDEDAMPNFEAEKEDSADEDDHEESEKESDKEEEGLAEDMDITAPVETKYSKAAKGNKREFPAHTMPKKKSGDQLEGMGPDLKKDDGSGSKPPVARKGGTK
jgi:hypothetical protein